MGLAQTQMIPAQELTAGQIGKFRNEAIEAVVAMAEKELGVPRDRLIVRDIRPLDDLEMYDSTGDTGTANNWIFTCDTSGTGWQAWCPDSTMADNRYIAIWGVRDSRKGLGTTETGAGIASRDVVPSIVAMLRITIGGAYKVIWDLVGMQAYQDNMTCFTPSAVIIPQNASYQFHLHKGEAAADDVHLQLIGVVVEPRGKVISP